MALNDMHVVMYKIISYLYECMKMDTEPNFNKWSASALGVPEGYWSRIVKELVDHRYVVGVKILEADDGLSVYPTSPHVTMEGVAFAMENSMMQKAKKFLQEAKSAIPFI